MAAATGLPEGVNLHLALANKKYKDNRIPPRGFTNAADRKSTRLNSSHTVISYAVFCL